MKTDSVEGAFGAFETVDGLGGADTDAVIEAAVRLFGAECFTVSDLKQVGHPIVHASDAFARLTGYAPDEILGKNLDSLQDGDAGQDLAAEMMAAVQAGRGATCVVRNYRRDGTAFFNEQRHLLVAAEDGRSGHLAVLHRDVTDAVHAAGVEAAGRALAESTGGKGASFGYAALLHQDGRAELTWVSESCLAVTGYEPGEILEAGFDALVADADRQNLADRAQRLARGERVHGRYRVRSKNGDEIPVEDFAMPAWSSRERGLSAAYGVVRDVSPVPEQGAPSWRDTHYDALTGLPNRRLLADRVQQALFEARREGSAAALALFDLDHFRFLNDTLGSRRGDRVLQEVATRLGAQLRRTDTLARVGEDVFAILLTKLPFARNALPVLEKLQASVLDPLPEAGATLRLSATVGVEIYPEGADSGEALLAHAEQALAEAKAAERGSYRFFAGGLDAAMRERVGLVRDLRRALLEDQLVLHYQPKVELKTGSISSVEALVRWAHPERGLLKPADFVPVAEEAHLGAELFGWVLEAACRQAMRWRQQRTSRRVAINASPQALQDPKLTARVTDALTRYDLHPGLLEIEINERAGPDVLDAAADELGRLRDIGVRVSLDDFGVDQGSLSQLRGMPLDGLKIDRSFVGRLGGRQDGEDVDLVRAIIGLGKSLRLRVTAEGIETREQNALLRDLACDDGQGFLFSQAVPPEYVPAFA